MRFLLKNPFWRLPENPDFDRVAEFLENSSGKETVEELVWMECQIELIENKTARLEVCSDFLAAAAIDMGFLLWNAGRRTEGEILLQEAVRYGQRRKYMNSGDRRTRWLLGRIRKWSGHPLFQGFREDFSSVTEIFA
ncbi:hypothetical protein [Leptospirillum ferriphilum]|uniref:hypothetical protein n=1 Tax=Leptospirillum ferriphilum TaxID=178606 RepID=UPI0006B1B7F5|nr:hypothetical protein [Leptospirillum ferriphilum]